MILEMKRREIMQTGSNCIYLGNCSQQCSFWKGFGNWILQAAGYKWRKTLFVSACIHESIPWTILCFGPKSAAGSFDFDFDCSKNVELEDFRQKVYTWEIALAVPLFGNGFTADFEHWIAFVNDILSFFFLRWFSWVENWIWGSLGHAWNLDFALWTSQRTTMEKVQSPFGSACECFGPSRLSSNVWRARHGWQCWNQSGGVRIFLGSSVVS